VKTMRHIAAGVFQGGCAPAGPALKWRLKILFVEAKTGRYCRFREKWEINCGVLNTYEIACKSLYRKEIRLVR
jgi:hypothetical protein